jgi:hypothetical protein
MMDEFPPSRNPVLREKQGKYSSTFLPDIGQVGYFFVYPEF